MEWNNTNVSILAGIFLLAGIIAWLVIPMIQADTTIFLTNGNGNTPVACNGNTGLVLAQNLTDLCDVTIISPSTSQIIQYNGSQWVNVDQVTFTNETTVCSGQAGDYNLVLLSVAGNCEFKNLLAGASISLSDNGTHITITNDAPESTQLLNLGSNGRVFKNMTGTLAYLRTISGSPDISVTEGTNTITIDYNGTLASESTVCTNDGHGSGNVCNAGNIHLKGIASGTGITITQNGTDIIVTSNAINESTVCSGQTGNYNIVASSSGGNCTFKNLVAGTGESLSSNSTHITITNTSPESTVCSGQSGNYNIVASSSGGNCTFKNLLAGTGESLSSNSTHITITNTLPESTTGTNLDSGAQVFKNMTATTLYFRTLLNGTGISVTSQANTLTFTSLYSCTSAGGTTLIKTSTTGLSCDLKGLTAGVGLTLTSNTNDNQYKTNFANGTGIKITGSGQQTFATNFVNGTGISITGSTSQTFTNTGVISGSCTSPISCSGTNPLSISCSTCDTTAESIFLVGNCSWSSGTSNTCSLSSSYRFYMFTANIVMSSGAGTANTISMQFNSDTGNNYAHRTSLDGAAEGTATSTSSITLEATACESASAQCSITCNIDDNSASTRKASYCLTTSGLGSSVATAPHREESSGKWDNTSAQISSITILHTGTRAFASGCELRVFGWN